MCVEVNIFSTLTIILFIMFGQGLKRNFNINKCVTICSYFVASAEANEENGVPLRKWHCLTIGSLSFLGT